MEQAIIFKLKDEYLPNFIKEYIQQKKITFSYKMYVYTISQKLFRKLKIQNIENSISNEDKLVFDFLSNDIFTKILSQKEYDALYKSGMSGTAGTAGYTGNTGATGASGWSGTSGTSGS